MIYIEDWKTEEVYATFETEEEAISWIKENCVKEEGVPGYYYNGNRVAMY